MRRIFGGYLRKNLSKLNRINTNGFPPLDPLSTYSHTLNKILESDLHKIWYKMWYTCLNKILASVLKSSTIRSVFLLPILCVTYPCTQNFVLQCHTPAENSGMNASTQLC